MALKRVKQWKANWWRMSEILIPSRITQSDSDYEEYKRYRVELIEPDRKFCELRNNALVWNFHAGQRKVMESKKRFITAIAGRQGGKSVCGPIWLHEEIRLKGPGLYMVVAPSYPILQDSAARWLGELFKTYRKLGDFRSQPFSFIISKEGEKRLFAGTPWAGRRDLPPTTIRFGHAANPESLEAKTALAAWLDEAGQDGFKLASWEAVEGRLTTTGGRVLITTTPYNLGWLKQRIIDPWEASGRDHPLIDVISWPSTVNPAFSEAEYLRLKETMPRWKWDMFYNGLFTVPAGLIYGIMRQNEDTLKIRREDIPTKCQHFGGLDFGGTNTCAVLAKRDKDNNIFLYRTYHPGLPLPIKEHVRRIFEGEQSFDRFAGGSKGEGTFREEFWQNGLRVEEPEINDVQQGIDRVYGLMAQNRLYVASDLDDWWNEVYTYQYETDPETGDVLPALKIKNQNAFHHMDATRYLCSFFASMDAQSIARAGGERQDLRSFEQQINRAVGLVQKQQQRNGSVARSGRIARGNSYDVSEPRRLRPRPGSRSTTTYSINPLQNNERAVSLTGDE
jgi:hypothetical protein